ncbi:MAG: hypothetical protein GY791_03385 [Alphaproteobacteria bacterium]|nr:hypothetical protein [Alphaproteobacteria bacterium]
MANVDKVVRALCAQEQFSDQLLSLPNVFGVASGLRRKGGQWTKEIAVQIFVTRKIPKDRLASRALVPRRLEAREVGAVATDVIEMEIPDAGVDPARYRPVPGGCSIGPEASVSAGTLGGWACDNTDDSIVLLTNNHVISNLDTMPAARRVVQPGRLDGGVLPGDVIGELKRDITLTTVANVAGAPLPAVTQVDAAVGTIEVERTDDVIAIGPAIYEVLAPAVGLNVQKRGRTTDLTTNGSITSVGGTFNVTYRSQTRLGRIANSFIVTSTDGNVFSDSGDSGSLIFDQAVGELEDTRPVVGLLFAGGTINGTPVTLGNDINAVFGNLNITTVCTCVLRSIIATAFSGEARLAGAAADSRLLRHKERQVRKMRYEIMEKSPAGQIIQHLLRTRAAALGQLMTEDDEAFGIAVELLDPWVKLHTNYEVLEAKIDGETIERFAKLAARAAERQKGLKPLMATMVVAVKAFEGETVRSVLRSDALGRKIKPRRKTKRPRKR